MPQTSNMTNDLKWRFLEQESQENLMIFFSKDGLASQTTYY